MWGVSRKWAEACSVGRALSPLALSLGVVVASGCGGGSMADNVKPKMATLEDVGGSSTANGEYDLFLIDWPPGEIAKLQSRIDANEGLLVAHYDPTNGVKLLPCVAHGSYKVSNRKITGEDEIHSTDKLGGNYAVMFKAEFQRGTKYKLHYVIVGSHGPSTYAVKASDIEGACGGAKPNYWISSVSVGSLSSHRETGATISAEATVAGSGGHGLSEGGQVGSKQLGDEKKCEDEKSKDCSVVEITLTPLDGAPSRALTKGLEPLPKPKAAGCRVDDPTAVKACHDACASGDYASCVVEGVFYDDGLSDLDARKGAVKLDRDQGAALFEKACQHDDINGCALLATAYMEGRGKKQDKAQGVKMFRESCDKGSDYACERMAVAYLTRDGVSARDPDQAASYFKKACDGGYLYACAEAAETLKDEHAKKDALQDLCTRGEGLACADLADDADKPAATRFELARHSCNDLSGFYGCFVLGGMYEKGAGVAKDDGKAVALYRFACENGGEEEGCNALGRAYKTGMGGLPHDDALAMKYFEEGCLGNPRDGAGSCLAFADGIWHGLGGHPADPTKAAVVEDRTCSGIEDFDLEDVKAACRKLKGYGAQRPGGKKGVTATAAVASAPAPQGPLFLIHPAGHDALCLDVSVHSGRIQVFQCKGSPNQQWSLAPQPGGAVELVGGRGDCVGSATAQADLQSSSCTDATMVRRYRFVGGRFTDAASGKCLTVTDFQNRGKLTAEKCAPTATGQQWVSVPAK